MPATATIRAPQHILDLLDQLHKQSLEQEASISKSGKAVSTEVLRDLRDKGSNDVAVRSEFDQLMLNKFIALDQDKCQFTYQLICAMNAINIVEAGTSFGVSAIYLALGIAAVKAATGKTGSAGKVIATEKEPEKAKVARGYWKQCGPLVEENIELREGDLLETLKTGLPETIDLLLLDIWTPLALPTLKTVQPRLRPGAVILTDNTITAADGYADLLSYLKTPENGFQNMTLPFTNGFEMSVYMPAGN